MKVIIDCKPSEIIQIMNHLLNTKKTSAKIKNPDKESKARLEQDLLIGGLEHGVKYL